MPVEELCRRVETGKARAGAAHERDRPQSSPSLAERLGGDSGRRYQGEVARAFHQYVARPPEMSNTAPVVNEHSAEAQNAASAANSSTSTKRARGILESM